MSARIILVPILIGNFEDITLRALRVLKECALIAAEDTRTSSILLKHYDINTPQTALHQHNEHHKIAQLLEKIQREEIHLAVITDAGTPGISDPGFLIVREALKMGIPLETLPGATAFVPALVGSGLPCDRFIFEGFLPLKKGRQTRLKALSAEERTLIFYESPHRIGKTIQDFIITFGAERQACLCREISKKFETFYRGTLSEIAVHIQYGTTKGEMVIIVGGSE